MNKEIDSYIGKQKSPQKEICLALRQLIQAAFPDIIEEMRWGVPAFGDGSFYIVALKDHVNMGFSSRGLSREELALFDGGGKTTKNIQIAMVDDIDTARIDGLMKLVHERNNA